jgi:hypothetical protein
LKNGDVFRIQPSTQTNNEWKKGIVKSKVNIRSYDVEVGQRIFRRNHRHIRQTHENFDQQKLNEDLEFDNDFASENKPETVPDAPTNNIPPQIYVTRSGREVKPPKRLDDFMCY